VDLRRIVLGDLSCIHKTLNRYRKVMKFVDVALKLPVKFIKDEMKLFGAEWNRGSSRSKLGVLRFPTSYILLSVITN
jgi:hypothetical protein